jgi:excisionase family DNA binding protein
MNKNNQIPKKLLKASQVAERLNISKALAYRLMQTGDLPCVQINTARRVRPQDLEEYIEDNLVHSSWIRK